jgi:hypothetical protein
MTQVTEQHKPAWRHPFPIHASKEIQYHIQHIQVHPLHNQDVTPYQIIVRLDEGRIQNESLLVVEDCIVKLPLIVVHACKIPCTQNQNQTMYAAHPVTLPLVATSSQRPFPTWTWRPGGIYIYLISTTTTDKLLHLCVPKKYCRVKFWLKTAVRGTHRLHSHTHGTHKFTGWECHKGTARIDVTTTSRRHQVTAAFSKRITNDHIAMWTIKFSSFSILLIRGVESPMTLSWAAAIMRTIYKERQPTDHANGRLSDTAKVHKSNQKHPIKPPHKKSTQPIPFPSDSS